MTVSEVMAELESFGNEGIKKNLPQTRQYRTHVWCESGATENDSEKNQKGS